MNAMREKFEKWARDHYWLCEMSHEFDDGEYIEPEMQLAWEAFQDALEIANAE